MLDEVSRGLGGQGFGQRRGKGAGALPPDMVNAIGENLSMQNAANGTGGSPANAIRAAMRFSGASEDIRNQRINTALGSIGALGGASVLPSASEFLQVGANKASQAANLEMQAGQQIYGAHQEHKNQLGQGLGMLAGIGAAPFTGGMSLMGGGLGGLGGFSSLFGGGGSGGSRQAQMPSGYYNSTPYGQQNSYRNTPFGYSPLEGYDPTMVSFWGGGGF